MLLSHPTIDEVNAAIALIQEWIVLPPGLIWKFRLVRSNGVAEYWLEARGARVLLRAWHGLAGIDSVLRFYLDNEDYAVGSTVHLWSALHRWVARLAANQ